MQMFAAELDSRRGLGIEMIMTLSSTTHVMRQNFGLAISRRSNGEALCSSISFQGHLSKT